MATKRKTTKTPETPAANEPPELNLLAAAQFNTRKAVRAFVASEEYQMLAELVSWALSPDAFPGEERLPRRLLAAAREGAQFLSGDLATLVALAARRPSAALVTWIDALWIGPLVLILALAAGWVGGVR